MVLLACGGMEIDLTPLYLLAGLVAAGLGLFWFGILMALRPSCGKRPRPRGVPPRAGDYPGRE
jgi:hypothetical protein